MLYKNNVNSLFKSKSVDKLSVELRELIIICRKNFYHSQEIQKRVYNKSVKLKSYTFDD